MNPRVNKLLKRRFLVAILGGFLLVIVLVFYSYYHNKAKLKIETSEPTSAITLTELPSGKEKKIGTGKASALVRKGLYNIRVSVGDSKVAKETVMLKSSEKKSVNFNLQPVKSTRIVSGDVAKSLKIADDGNLIFLNSIFLAVIRISPLFESTSRIIPGNEP